ncbi:MAG: protein tyrosine phosphatase, partial [Pseudomonadota bacterium]
MTQLRQRLKDAERKVRSSFGDDISTPAGRWQAWAHFNLMDHAFLRVWWTNFGQVADGVYRSNHPGPKRLEKYKQMGIKTVLNLRGNDGYSPWLLEEEACERLGMDLVVRKIYARKPARQ